MIINIFSIGKIKSNFIREGEGDYLKRLKLSPFRISTIELGIELKGSTCEVKLRREADKFFTHITPTEILIVLDEQGVKMSSLQFSQFIGNHMNMGTKKISFAIGSAAGWHKSVISRATIKLSLSDLTFPFQFTRLILIEQLYRAHSILTASPYHKE